MDELHRRGTLPSRSRHLVDREDVCSRHRLSPQMYLWSPQLLPAAVARCLELEMEDSRLHSHIAEP